MHRQKNRQSLFDGLSHTCQIIRAAESALENVRSPTFITISKVFLFSFFNTSSLVFIMQKAFKGFHRSRAFALLYMVLQGSRFLLNSRKDSLIECHVSSPYCRGYFDRFGREFSVFQFHESTKNLVFICQKCLMTDQAKCMN